MRSLNEQLNSSSETLEEQVKRELAREEPKSRSSRSHENEDNKSSKKGAGKKSKPKKMIRVIAVILLGFFIISAILTIPVLLETPFSVAVLGIDTGEQRQGGNYQGEDKFAGYRADTIQYITVNPRKNHLTAMQIPRDTNASYSCENYDGVVRDHTYKINEAHVNGGVDCMIAAIEQGVNLPVDYYIRLDFDDFVEIIDDIGGVEIISIDTFCEQDSQAIPNAYCFTEGETYLMNGEEGLAYARHRSTSSDFRRGLRQQQIVESISKELRSLGLRTAIEVGLDLIDNFDHNIPLSKMASLGTRMILRGAPSYDAYSYESVRINGTQYAHPDDLKKAYSGTLSNLGMINEINKYKRQIEQRYENLGYIE